MLCASSARVPLRKLLSKLLRARFLCASCSEQAALCQLLYARAKGFAQVALRKPRCASCPAQVALCKSLCATCSVTRCFAQSNLRRVTCAKHFVTEHVAQSDLRRGAGQLVQHVLCRMSCSSYPAQVALCKLCCASCSEQAAVQVALRRWLCGSCPAQVAPGPSHPTT